MSRTASIVVLWPTMGREDLPAAAEVRVPSPLRFPHSWARCTARRQSGSQGLDKDIILPLLRVAHLSLLMTFGLSAFSPTTDSQSAKMFHCTTGLSIYQKDGKVAEMP